MQTKAIWEPGRADGDGAHWNSRLLRKEQPAVVSTLLRCRRGSRVTVIKATQAGEGNDRLDQVPASSRK